MRIAVKDLLFEHAAEVLDIAAEHLFAESLTLQPLGTDSAADCDRRAEMARAATREAEAQLARERAGESVRPAFRGALDALRQLDRIDGVAVKTSSVWDLIDPKSTGRTESAASAVERLAVPSREWAMCLADGWVITTSPVRVELTAEQARAVCVWGVLGFPHMVKPTQSPTPISDGQHGALRQKPARPIAMRGRFDETFAGGFDSHHEPSAPEVAEYASRKWGVEVPVGHAVRIRVAGVREFYGRLHARGLVLRDRRLEMASDGEAPVFDLSGWKEISTFLGASERAAQRWIAEHMPVYSYGPSVVARKSELRAWQRARMQPKAVAK